MPDKKFSPTILIATFTLLLWTISVFAQGMPPNIMQVQVESYVPGEPLRIKAIFTDDGPLGECLLYFRLPTETGYDYVPFNPEYDYFVAEIAPEFLEVGRLEYYILASDMEGNIRTSPEINPDQNPYKYSLRLGEGKPTTVYLLSPEPGSVIPVGRELIVVSFYDPDDDTAPNSIQLILDGKDVTSKSQVSQYLITYTPEQDFSEGKHKVEIMVRDYAGNVTPPKIYDFMVQKSRGRGVVAGKYQGSFTTETKYDQYTGKEQPENRPLDQTLPRLQMKADWGWLKSDLDLFYNLYVNEDARTNAEHRQTLNRYRLRFQTTPLTLVIGDDNPRFSELTMKGTRIRGLSADFNSGFLGLKGFYGESKNKVDPYVISAEDSILADSIEVAPDTWEYIYQFGVATPVYKRDAYGLRTSIYFARNSDRFLNDAEWGLNFLRFKDNLDDSLHFRQQAIDLGGYDYANYDSLEMRAYLWSLVPPIDPDSPDADAYWQLWQQDNAAVEGRLGRPKDNLVFSTTLDFRLFRKTFISFETAVSILNDNQYASRSLIDSADNADVQEMDDFLKSNFNFNLNNEVNPLFPKAVLYADLRTPLPYVATNLNLNYRRVPETYNSLGNPSIQTDISALKADTRTRLFKNRVTLNLGGETKVNNLYNAKDKTTTTNTYSSGLGLVFPNYPTLNLGYRMINRDAVGLADVPYDTIVAGLDTSYNYADSTYTQNNTSTITTAIGYQYQYGNWSANANVNLMIMQYRDEKNSDYDFDNNSVMLSLVLSPPLPVGLEFGFGNTVNAPKYSLYNETVYNIINSRLSYYMLDNRLTNYIGAELMTGQKDPDDLSPDGIDNTKRSLKAGCRWKIKPDAILALEAENIDYQDNAVDPAEDEFSYTENRITVKFEIKF